METAPEGLSPGTAAGNCLLALTRQPLRRPGQPKAAAPDSCIRAASAPGERSCIHGKPITETGQLHFPGAFRDACRARATAAGNGFCHSGAARAGSYDVDAAFMRLERKAACLIGPRQDVVKPDIQCVRTH